MFISDSYLIPYLIGLLAYPDDIDTARQVIPFQSYLRFVLYNGSADGDDDYLFLLRGLHIEAAILGIYLSTLQFLNTGRGLFLYTFHGDIDFGVDIADFILALLVRLDNIRITSV